MKSMDIVLEQIHTTLRTAINDPEVLTLLSRRGYDIAELQTGMTLVELARDSVQTQGIARFSKVNATQTFHETWRVAKIQYHHDVRVARLALNGLEGSRYFLHLDNSRLYTFDAWYVQAKEFYHSLRNQAELLALVARLGLTNERIDQGIQQLQALAVARTQQQTQKGSAVSSQRQRNQAFEDLTEWMTAFRQYARLALASTPEYLTILGLDSVSQKTSRKANLIKMEAPVVEPANRLVMS